MTAKDYATLKADLSAAIPDNTTGLVDPVDVRETGLVDSIDSILTGITSVANLLAMDVTSFADGTIAQVSGFAAAGDGGGGEFRLQKAHGLTVDDGVIVDANWRRVLNGASVTPQMWGAKGTTDLLDVPGSPDDTAALQDWLDYVNRGVWENDLVFDANFSPTGYLPPGRYKFITPLNFNLTNNRASIGGAAQFGSILVTGAAMTHMLQTSLDDPLAGVFTNHVIENIHFDGNDLADTGIRAIGSRVWSLRNCRVNHCLVSCVDCGNWAVSIERCLIEGNNKASARVAAGIRVSSDFSNGLWIENNWILNCTVGVQIDKYFQKLSITYNVIENCDQTAIFIKEGCQSIDIKGNYFEDNGDLGVSVEVTSGVFETWDGVIVATPIFNAVAGFPVGGLSIHDNLFTNNNRKAIVSIRRMDDFNFYSNVIAASSSVEALVVLKREGSWFTPSANTSRNVVDHVEGQSADQLSTITAVNTTTDTITVGENLSLVPGLPFKLSGSLPAPLVNGEWVFAMVEADTNEFQISRTIDNQTAIVLTTATTGGFLFRVSQVVRALDLRDPALSQEDNTAGIVVRHDCGALLEKGSIGSTRSLGGNPGGWDVSSGTPRTTKVTTEKFENLSQIWRIDGSGEREFIINLEEKFGLRGQYLRLHGITRGEFGGTSGRWIFEVTTVDGTTTQLDHSTNVVTVYNEFHAPIIWIPWDATSVRLRFLNTSAIQSLLVTRLSVADAALVPSTIPFGTEEDPPFEATTIFNPGNILDGAGVTALLTLTGAVFGDFVAVAAPYDLQGIQAMAYVSAVDAVQFRLDNNTGGAVNLASGTWRVKLTKPF